MWDIPVEAKAQKEIAVQAFGDVLVAGYGLGVVQRYLTKNPKVKSVTTVELLEDVITKTKKVYGKTYGQIEIGDFYKYPEDKKYDVVVGDIWEDVVPVSLRKYKRFKRKADKLTKPKGKILAWGKDFFEYLLDK